MLHFTRGDAEADLSCPLDRIKDLSSKIEQRIAQKGAGADEFVETLSVEELKDLRQVVLASEYLLTKYRDRQDLRGFLQDFVGIIMNAVNSVNGLESELEDLLISADVVFRQIQKIHHEMTHDLEIGRTVQTKMDDYEPQIVPSVPEKTLTFVQDAPSPINFTNTTRRIHTSDYLEKTPVEV